MVRFFVSFLLVLCLANVAEARGRRSYTSTSTSVTQTVEEDKAPTYPVEHRLLAAINTVRERYGLRALVLDRTTHMHTRSHCIWMARRYSLQHTSRPVIENIAMGQHSVDGVVNSWMNSSGHRANILNPYVTSTGVAAYTTESGTIFWCQQFN